MPSESGSAMVASGLGAAAGNALVVVVGVVVGVVVVVSGVVAQLVDDGIDHDGADPLLSQQAFLARQKPSALVQNIAAQFQTIKGRAH